MESYLSLGSPSTMYQGREGGFEIPHIKQPRDEERVITLLCWPELPKQYQQCVTQSWRQKGLDCWPPNNLSPSQRREREIAPEAELGKQHLCIRTQNHCLGALWQVGKNSSPYQTFNKKRPSAIICIIIILTLFNSLCIFVFQFLVYFEHTFTYFFLQIICF